MLLQIMEDGQLADAKGKRIDFRNTIIILTSNVGADLIKRVNIGFTFKQDTSKTEEERYKEMRKKVMGEMERMFRPEFRNRLDGVMIFKALTKEQIKDIMEYELRDVRSRLYDKDIAVTMTDAAKDYLAEEGYDPEFGARPLRRVLQQHIEDPLSEGILSGKYQDHDTLEVDYQDEEIIINIIGRAEEQIPAVAEPVNPLEAVM